VNGGSQRFRGIELMTAMKPKPMLEWRVVYSLHDAPSGISSPSSAACRRSSAGTAWKCRPATWRDRVHRRQEHRLARQRAANWVRQPLSRQAQQQRGPDYITWSAGIGYALQGVEIRLDAVNINNQRPPVSESELGTRSTTSFPRAASLRACAGPRRRDTLSRGTRARPLHDPRLACLASVPLAALPEDDVESILRGVPDAASFSAHLKLLTRAPHPTGSTRDLELADYVRTASSSTAWRTCSSTTRRRCCRAPCRHRWSWSSLSASD